MSAQCHPALILAPNEHFECYVCGDDIAGMQAHFDGEGNVFCVDHRDFVADEQERKKR